MVITRLLSKITKSAHLDGEVEAIGVPSVNKQVKSLLDEGKPVTVWELATKLGNGNAEQASAILDGLTAEGVLARFRAGFNNYYALPEVALTGDGPTLRTVISGSVKNLFLDTRYKVATHLKQYLR